MTERSAGVPPTPIRDWVGVVAGLMLGQAGVRLLQFLGGILIVRWLPVDEFALFTVASLLLTLVTLGANLGLTNALISLGAPVREQTGRLAALFAASQRLSRRLFVFALPVVVAVAVLLLPRHSSDAGYALLVLAAVLALGYLQVELNLARSVFNLQHDARAMSLSGIVEMACRLLLLAILLVSPLAAAALLAGILGAAVGRRVAWRRLRAVGVLHGRANAADRARLRAFIGPLVPSTLYFAFQGQIAVFVLSIAGQTQYLAEYGALARLGQVVSLLAVLNPFLIQPLFARVATVRVYATRSLLVVGAWIALAVVILLTAHGVPGAWLFILGDQYRELSAELPLALLVAVLHLLGMSLYAIAIARSDTRGQSWVIAPSLAAQLAFIAVHGVHSVSDALVVSLIPALFYALLQAVLIVRNIRQWGDAVVQHEA